MIIWMDVPMWKVFFCVSLSQQNFKSPGPTHATRCDLWLENDPKSAMKRFKDVCVGTPCMVDHCCASGRVCPEDVLFLLCLVFTGFVHIALARPRSWFWKKKWTSDKASGFFRFGGCMAEKKNTSSIEIAKVEQCPKQSSFCQERYVQKEGLIVQEPQPVSHPFGWVGGPATKTGRCGFPVVGFLAVGTPGVETWILGHAVTCKLNRVQLWFQILSFIVSPYHLSTLKKVVEPGVKLHGWYLVSGHVESDSGCNLMPRTSTHDMEWERLSPYVLDVLWQSPRLVAFCSDCLKARKWGLEGWFWCVAGALEILVFGVEGFRIQNLSGSLLNAIEIKSLIQKSELISRWMNLGSLSLYFFPHCSVSM